MLFAFIDKDNEKYKISIVDSAYPVNQIIVDNVINRTGAEDENQNNLRVIPACPIPSCLCYDCPSRGGCVVERDMHLSGACTIEGGPRIQSCSRKKSLKGEFDDVKKETIAINIGGRGGYITSSRDDGDFWSSVEVPTVGG